MTVSDVVAATSDALTRPMRWSLRHGQARSYFAKAAEHGDVFARLALDRDLQGDPFPLYEEIRQRGPGGRGRAGGAFVGHAAVMTALRGDGFSVGLDAPHLPSSVRFALRHAAGRGSRGPADQPSMLVTDPPLHDRHRRLVSKVFTARAVERLRERVEEVAEQLLDGLEQQGGTADVMAGYARLLPVEIISEILGVPAGMRDQVLDWGRAVAPGLDIGLPYRDFRRVDRAMGTSNAWLRGHLRRLAANPGDDLTSRLVTQAGEEGLSEVDLLSITGLLLAAGFETTVNLIGNGTQLLLQHPDQREALKGDPGLWPNAIEEILRYDSPVQSTGRTAADDTELDGHRVRRGALLILLIGGANRDPEVFTDPARFDVTRANAKEHLAFSAGIHFCLGAALARIEGVVALQRLFERFPDLTPAGEPERQRTRILRGYVSQPVRLR